jgi:outer membrane lipoprotein-sorting protein
LRLKPAGRSTRVLLLCLLGCRPSPSTLVGQAVEARGGVERLRGVQTQVLTGKISFGAQAGVLRVEFKRPHRMRMEILVPHRAVVRLFDGVTGWTSDTSGTPAGFRPMSPLELEKARREADMDGPLVDSEAKGIRLAVAEGRVVQGRATDALEVTFKDGTVERYLLDRVTHEPVGWSERELIDGKEVERFSEFRATQRVDGVLVPTSIETEASGSRPVQRILIEHIDFNVPIDDARFRPSTPDGGPSP